jgi:hypothetical protein
MQTLTYNQLDEQRGVSSATVTAPADGVSDWVLGPCGAYPLTIAVHPGAGGTAVCRITTSRIEEIVAGTALWQPWGLGTVAADTIDALQSPVVALHLAATGAAATMDIVAGN